MTCSTSRRSRPSPGIGHHPDRPPRRPPVPVLRRGPRHGRARERRGHGPMFQLARRLGIGRLVYASSAAVYGPAARYGVDVLPRRRALPDLVVRRVQGRRTSRAARVAWETEGVASIGLRPHSVYGPGRDQGVTSKPTVAMIAAAGRAPVPRQLRRPLPVPVRRGRGPGVRRGGAGGPRRRARVQPPRAGVRRGRDRLGDRGGCSPRRAGRSPSRTASSPSPAPSTARRSRRPSERSRRPRSRTACAGRSALPCRPRRRPVGGWRG